MKTSSYSIVNPEYKSKVRDSFDRQGFMEFIGAKLVRIEPGICEIELPYKKELSQQHGYFHAGIVSSIADNASGYAAFSLMDPNSSILTVEYKINLLSAAKGYKLMAAAKVVKKGRTLCICSAEIYAHQKDQEPKLCAISQATLIELQNTNDEKK